jgi:hypothetical protein
MFGRRIWLFVGALGAFVLGVSATAAAGPSQQTIEAGAFQVQWSASDPEEITSLTWDGSSNLTNEWTNPGQCPGNPELEFFGNAWGTGGFGTHPVLVGGGTTGTWSSRGPSGVSIASAASGCPPQTGGIPVTTKYHLFANGNEVNRILLTRTFSFGTTPFTTDVRPYIPRLYPDWEYRQVIHPDASGTGLVTEDQTACDGGCEVANWNDTWFAVHDPSSGQGMIVRKLSPYPSALWVDQDGGSATSASSVLLLQPSGGFTGTVTETESLCFYNSDIWTPSLKLPPGC